MSGEEPIRSEQIAAELKRLRQFFAGIILVFAGIILALCANYVVSNWGQDSTDKGFWSRSGMRLYTDAATGCQYLATSFGSLHPRLNSSGQHMCGAQP